MTGIVNVYIPLRGDGERMTGVIPRGQRARATFTRSAEGRSFFDPEADRNASNAIPLTNLRHPFHPRNVAKRRPLPKAAPAGWSLKPMSQSHASAVVAAAGEPELEGPTHCGKRFRTSAGFAWHLANIHAGSAA
jgi:hypothetical protein